MGGHKKERTANKSNPRVNSLSTNFFEYPAAVGQKPSHAISASNAGILSHNIELLSIPLSSLKRAINDIELGAGSALPSGKRPRNDDPQQHNTVPGRMVRLSARSEELDLSLHLWCIKNSEFFCSNLRAFSLVCFPIWACSRVARLAMESVDSTSCPYSLIWYN